MEDFSFIKFGFDLICKYSRCNDSLAAAVVTQFKKLNNTD